MKILIIQLLFLSIATLAYAQKKPLIKISGTAGVTYEGYGLDRTPNDWAGYLPRRPWNQVRFNFMPNIQFGKNFSIPFNINLATKPTNFAGPYSGIGNLGKQSFWQYITNPINNVSINPTYKWAELQLGTQYIKYSDLSTGDIGVFGAGVSLKPKKYFLNFFAGTSQAAIGFNPSVSITTGAYKRNHWMAQLGKEEEGKYKLAFNFSKGRDDVNTTNPPNPLLKPEEGFVISLVSDIYFKKGFYIKSEIAQSNFTKDQNTPFATSLTGFKPFVEPHVGTNKDYAGQLQVGKKMKKFDVGIMSKYVGAGFQTTGFPYLQNDHLDYTVNTKINAWKNKMNIVANVGERINNISNTAPKNKQFIGNINWFTQFSNMFSLNVNYNNFGFNTQSTTLSGLPSYKNVSNDLGITPSFTFTNTKASHLLNMSYNYSVYDEQVIVSGVSTLTSYKTHTALLTYVPTYFKKKAAPDFSVMYLVNNVTGAKLSLFTVSSALSLPLAKDKLQVRGQLQYTNTKLTAITPDDNFIASVTLDWKLHKKLTWRNFLTSNYYKYGNQFDPVYPKYLESTCRTGFHYNF
jgi:hypothetical protein